VGNDIVVGEPASVAVERLRSGSVAPQRLLIQWLIRGRVEKWHEREGSDMTYRSGLGPTPDPHLADEAVVSRAAALGLTYMGVAVESSLFSRIRKDVWLNDDRTVQLHSRKRKIRDHAPRSVYHLSTYFDDGSCILTWSHPPMTPSTDALASRAGTGELRADYHSHRDACSDWCRARRTRALVVDGPDAVARLIGHYYRYVVPKSAALTYTVSLLGMLVLLANLLGALATKLIHR